MTLTQGNFRKKTIQPERKNESFHDNQSMTQYDAQSSFYPMNEGAEEVKDDMTFYS